MAFDSEHQNLHLPQNSLQTGAALLAISRNESSSSITEKRTQNYSPNRRQSEALPRFPKSQSVSSKLGGIDFPNKNAAKTKLWTNIERRITAVSHEEYLKKKDVTLEEKRTLYIYTLLNLLAFIVQVVVLVIAESFKNNDNKNKILEDTPVTVIREIFYLEIAIIVLLEILFIILPIPSFRCFGSRQHINNILLLKVKWFFSLQCIFQTLAIISFTKLKLLDKLLELIGLHNLPLSVISFFLLKLYVHYFGYKRIKYLDDGRDYVSIKEFFSVHCTFSVINSWTTYFLCYNLFVYLLKFNQFKLFDDYMSVVVMILMVFESTIYLAYYKDVIFSLITLMNYIGMYLFNFDARNENPPEALEVEKCQIVLIVLLSFFIVVTVLHDFDKVFYLQYAKFYNKHKERRLGMNKGKKKLTDQGDLDDWAGGRRGRNYSFVAWKQYYKIQHDGEEEVDEMVYPDENASVISGAETEDQKGAVDWQYDDNNTELDFGNRSPFEEIESDSIMSKRQKGTSSLLSSRLGRQSEDIKNRSPKKGGAN
jgi:hypothetical protein